MSAITFEGGSFSYDSPEIKFRKILVAKLRRSFKQSKELVQHSWTRTKNVISHTTSAIEVGTKAVGSAAKWTITQVAKAPHWLGLGAEILGKVLVGLVNAVLVAAAILVVIAFSLIWGTLDLIFWIGLITLSLISTALSTPYHALVGGTDAVAASWRQFWFLSTKPFKSVRRSFKTGFVEMKNFFAKPDTRLSYEEAYEEASLEDFTDMRPEDTGIRGKGRPTPKRPPQHRSQRQSMIQEAQQPIAES